MKLLFTLDLIKEWNVVSEIDPWSWNQELP